MRTQKKKKRTGWKGILVVIAAVILLFLDSNFRIQTTTYEIESEKIPEAFDGFRILQLSDLHNREFGEENEKLLQKVQRKEPDIIVVTGDLTDETTEDLEGFVTPLMKGLVDIAPTFYVSGNHEWASGHIQELFDLLESLGVRALRNDYVKLELGGSSVILAGAEDPNGPYDMMTPQELREEIRKEQGDAYLVMLYHRNDAFKSFADLDTDLLLCGHAHGGIIRLPFTDGLVDPNRNWFPTHTAGIYTQKDSSMVVSRGLGWHIPVPRLFNNPHIPVVVLRTK